MILVPGHIYMAANLRMTEAEAMRQFHGTEDLIIRNDEAWLPIEVTSISDGFVAAWRAGARRWREAVSAGDVDFVVTSEAWEAYEPVGLPASEQQITLPPTDGVRQSFQDQLDRYIDQTLYPMVERIEERMVERGRQPSLVNSLAVLYARYGRLTEARSELENLLDEHPGYAPAIANLGNICFLEGETEEAVNYFERALALEPDNASILVALARASHQLENYGTAQRAYDRVKELEPALAAEYSYLELRDGGGARAAEAGAEAATPWVEETE
jgi:tetratricopeptide (TPR) repeat protein